MDTSAIKRAVEIVGSQSLLAKAIGAHKVLVNQWVLGQRPIPARWCIPIEQATGGAVTRYQLRPDVFGEAPVTSQTEAA